MHKIRSLDEAVNILLTYSPPKMGWNFHLEQMKTLLEALGNPQEKCKVIHIAGTSGKTSTAYLIRSLLHEAGVRTGLTVSPHIVAVNERIQIDGALISEDNFLRYLNEFIPLIEATKLKPSYFSFLAAMAFWVFAEEGVEYAVIETGFGGRLDATNTVSRADKVCVLTNIGFDHTQWLGTTLEAIAGEKAGIIQPGNHVIARDQTSEVMNVFRAAAIAQHASLKVVTDTNAPAFLPEFQHQNWAMARAVYDYIRSRDHLPNLNEEQCERAAHQTPPGRGEVYQYGDKTIILDGAHNPQKLEALIHSLRSDGHSSAAVLASIVEGPDSKLNSCIEIIENFASHWIVPEFYVGQDVMNRRSVGAGDIVARTNRSKTEAVPDLHQALQLLLGRPERILLITGSLYLVSLIRPEILRLQRK